MAFNAFRTGIVALTIAVKHICRIQAKFGPQIQHQIDLAVSMATITSAQGAQLTAALSAITAACDILRAVSLY
jgi:hypothetical protein